MEKIHNFFNLTLIKTNFICFFVGLVFWGPISGAMSLDLDIDGKERLLSILVDDSLSYLPPEISRILDWTIRVEWKPSVDVNKKNPLAEQDLSTFFLCEEIYGREVYELTDPRDWLGDRLRYQTLRLNSDFFLNSSLNGCHTVTLVKIWSYLFGLNIRIHENAGFLTLANLNQQSSVLTYFSDMMAEYLTNSRFQCQYPDLTLFFEQILNLKNIYRDLSSANCLKEDGSLMEVSLIYVTPGESLMESWGHIMFRIQACLGAESSCDYVISFFADSPEDLNLWNGLINSSILSKAFIFTYQEAFDNYIHRGQRQFVEYSFDVHKVNTPLLYQVLMEALNKELDPWHHLMNNCAINTSRMIQVATSDLWTREDAILSTPYRLVYFLENERIISKKFK